MKYCNCYVYVLNFDFNIRNFNIYIYSIFIIKLNVCIFIMMNWIDKVYKD